MFGDPDDEFGGGGGAALDGFLAVGGTTGGFLPVGGAGFDFAPGTSGAEVEDCAEGLRAALRAPTFGILGAAFGRGGGIVGGRGLAPFGLEGTPIEDCETLLKLDSCEESSVSCTPPDFRSFGMPAANSPPSCGGASIPPPPLLCN